MSLGHEQPANTRLIHTAIEAGINLFDTADIYDKGWNEETVGQALKNRRDKVIVCTKVGNQWKADGSGLDWNPSRQHILESIDASLRRLQTDYIDLYQLHGGTIQDNREEVIEAFEQLQREGKIRHYGISSIRANVIREYVQYSSLATVMMQYSLLDRRPEESCLALLAENNISVLARGTLAQGLLTGKPPKPYLGHSAEMVAAAAAAINSCSTSERTPAQTALQYACRQPAIASVVVGIRTLPQLEELAKAPDAPPLAQEEIGWLEEAVPAFTYTDHR